MERISKRREEDYKSVREFYMQSATLLSQKQPESRHIYAVSCLVSYFRACVEQQLTACRYVMIT
jgi:hypothetical protein